MSAKGTYHLKYGVDYHAVDVDEANRLSFPEQPYELLELIPALESINKPVKFEFAMPYHSFHFFDMTELLRRIRWCSMRLNEVAPRDTFYNSPLQRYNSYRFVETSDALIRTVAVRDKKAEYFVDKELHGIRIKNHICIETFRKIFESLWNGAIGCKEHFDQVIEQTPKRLRKHIQGNYEFNGHEVFLFPLYPWIPTGYQIEEQVQRLGKERKTVEVKIIFDSALVETRDEEIGVSTILHLGRL